METFVWIVVGAATGWLAFSVLGLNSDRGRLVSMAMGAVGALVGGKMIAPMLISAPLEAAVSVPSVAVATVAATAVLVLGNVVQNRWNV